MKLVCSLHLLSLLLLQERSNTRTDGEVVAIAEKVAVVAVQESVTSRQQQSSRACTAVVIGVVVAIIVAEMIGTAVVDVFFLSWSVSGGRSRNSISDPWVPSHSTPQYVLLGSTTRCDRGRLTAAEFYLRHLSGREVYSVALGMIVSLRCTCCFCGPSKRRIASTVPVATTTLRCWRQELKFWCLKCTSRLRSGLHTELQRPSASRQHRGAIDAMKQTPTPRTRQQNKHRARERETKRHREREREARTEPTDTHTHTNAHTSQVTWRFARQASARPLS